MCASVYRNRHLVKATKVNAGLAESSGRLLLGIWRDSLHVTCGLTACTPGSTPGPTLGNEYGKTLIYVTHLQGAQVTLIVVIYFQTQGGSVAEWLARWTQAQLGPGSNLSRDAVG